MKKLALICMTVACAVVAGCFDNWGKPADATPVTSLKALAATNRAEVVRLVLRKDADPIAEDAFADLPKLEVLDISERKLKKVPSSVFGLKTLKHHYLTRNELEAVPDELG